METPKVPRHRPLQISISIHKNKVHIYIKNESERNSQISTITMLNPMICAKQVTFRRDGQFSPGGQPMTLSWSRVLRTKSQRRVVPCRGFPCHIYSYLSSMGFQTRTSHVPPVLALALFSIGRARCALLGFSAPALAWAMAVVVIARQGSEREENGKAAARQLALERISSDKCNKAPTLLL